jgi:uncharacterized protein YbjQ (UPF0145 family)
LIISTTPTIQNRNITACKGIVCGEVIIGAHLGKDILASFTNIFGGRSDAYEKTIRETRNGAMDEMIHNAEQLGANAVVAVKFDYQVIGQSGSMMMVAVSGTAVVID